MINDERDPVIESFFDGLEPPPPPAGLRDRVLEAARSSEASRAPVDPWARIWNHSGLRMAWAASVAVLITSHLIVGSAGGPQESVIAENQIDQIAVEFLRPVEISANVRPIVGLFATVEAPGGPEERGESS